MRVGVAFGVCLVLFSVFGDDHGLHAVLKARRDARQLETTVAALRAENATLRNEAQALQSDPAAIEAVARGVLGMARPDEMVLTRRP
jgi:cell division protein FtsB